MSQETKPLALVVEFGTMTQNKIHSLNQKQEPPQSWFKYVYSVRDLLFPIFYLTPLIYLNKLNLEFPYRLSPFTIFRFVCTVKISSSDIIIGSILARTRIIICGVSPVFLIQRD